MDSDEHRPHNDPPPTTMAAADPPATTPSDPGTETPKMAHDSMVTVRLSEPTQLKLDTSVGPNAGPVEPVKSVEPESAEPDSVESDTVESDSVEPEPVEPEPVEPVESVEPESTESDSVESDPVESEPDPVEPVESSERVEPSEPAAQDADSEASDTASETTEATAEATAESKEDTTPPRNSTATLSATAEATAESKEDATPPRDSTATLSASETSRSLQDELGQSQDDDDTETGSSGSDEVNWEQLEKTEDEQTKDDETDNVTALLLARLEQENAKLATNPKSAKVQSVDEGASKPRPPSMAQLREMVNGPTPSALRYSMLPPPPMTDLEFYAALVKDYQQTAGRLPTLLSNKIRKGIPPPLRGVVWQSMSGARDAVLEEQYERFCGESSPYEFMIGKDLGRSFPGVDMFRDPDGDGQRMLARVLKSFSLYDTKIGYCQGLAFLVGPLLMHMPDKQAFCVLVRLMERYDLRSCFLPDLSGLHVRIYQFRELLRHNLPALSAHLEELQVDPAYVSQWFLSFFAITCPLPMLFRIYDVIFAEGAPETLMRVALSLMRKNEARLLACTELEDVMGLLLSRGLWDCYHYNADEFVQDFVSLTSEVTLEKLSQLEKGYRQSLVATANAARASDITTAASRFLGRIWASSITSAPKSAANTNAANTNAANTNAANTNAASTNAASTNAASTDAASTDAASTDAANTNAASTNVANNAANTNAANLSPGLSAPSRPLSMLRRSPSKQSLASTLNSIEASSASVASSTSTEATTASRDSSNTDDESSSRESTPVGPKSTASVKTTDDKYLHSQIEDLLTALSELQRNNALMSNQLQREREEREEDRKAVWSLLDGLKKKTATDSAATAGEEVDADADDTEDDGDGATPLSDETEKPMRTPESVEMPTEDLPTLLEKVEGRFVTENKHRSSMLQSKAQLRDELGRVRDQLASSESHSQDLSRRMLTADQELSTLREQLKEGQGRIRTLHQDKQRLERQIHGMRSRASSTSAGESGSRDVGADWAPKSNTTGGLRELKLGRSRSTPSQSNGFNKRMSSLPVTAATKGTDAAAAAASPSDQENLLLELVQAKTAEATAKQEALEAKQKLEAFRKSHGMAPGDAPVPATPPSATATPAAAAAAAMGVFGRLTGHTAAPSASESGGKAATSSTTSTASGGFWGWRR